MAVVFAYAFDTMARAVSLTQTGGFGATSTWASGTAYGPAGDMTQITVQGGVETRQYNLLGQLTRITVPGAVDLEYRYHATQNDGRITQMKNWVSGEAVNYTYDSLNRLETAYTTGPEWGLSFSYDGFGNRARCRSCDS